MDPSPRDTSAQTEEHSLERLFEISVDGEEENENGYLKSVTERLKQVEERERNVCLREKEIKAKSSAMRSVLMKEKEELMKKLENKKKKFDLKQKKWIEKKSKKAKLVERSLEELVEKEKKLRSFYEEKVTEMKEMSKALELKQRELDAKEKELKEKANELEKKEEILKAKASEMEWKRKFLEVAQGGFEGISTQGGRETSKRSRVKYVAEKSCEAAGSFIRPAKRRSIPVMIQEDEDSVRVAEACASSSRLIVEPCEREVEESVFSIDDDIEEEEQEAEPITCPDSEFHDFNKTMDSFEVGQVWALYDPVDDMPRLYGRITKVIKSQLSLRITWVESRNEEEGASVVIEPVSCGRFKYGTTETQSYLMFSHEMQRVIKGQYLIKMYPKEGETWAMFRDWSNNPALHKAPYRYDVVEILFDFDDHRGVGVAYLGKVEGFVSVFKREGKHGVLEELIQPAEMNRFSHRVPSFKLSGEEKEGVPAGSYELDPAAVPSSVLQPDQSIRRETTETTCEVENQGGSRNDDPIILD